MRARLGLEPLAVAVRDARHDAARLQEDPHLRGAEDAVLPILLVELGIAQNWLGELADAEASLTAAVTLGRFRDLPVVAAAAASHLAFTEYMSGRERACVQVATEALDTLAAVTGVHPSPKTVPTWRCCSPSSSTCLVRGAAGAASRSRGSACGGPADDVLAAAARRTAPSHGAVRWRPPNRHWRRLSSCR